MALGATSGSIIGMALREGMGLTLKGVAAGILATLLLVNFMQSQLFGVAALDAWSFSIVSLFTLSLALLVCLFTIHPLARLQPADSLRSV